MTDININDMEKTVTKEELQRVLTKHIGDSVGQTILNELWPPEFKVGDKVVVIPNDGIREISSIDGNKFWFTSDTWEFGCNLRHATPDEIAAAEWEPNKPYKVFWSGSWRLYVSAERVGNFYQGSRFEGDSIAISKYEKL